MISSLTGQHILIVDDKPTNLKVLATTLTESGFDIAVATNGKMALQQAIDDPPELILLDILMPEMDGFETCQQLKANPTTQEIPVIFMTALTDVVDKVRGFSLGAVDYITKPFETEEVLARVRTHLQLHTLTRTIEENNHRLSEALERLQATQQQIIAQEKLATIGALTAGIVHELRNPLNLVKNYGEGSIELSDDLLTEIQAHSPPLSHDETLSLGEFVGELRENASTITRHAKRAEDIIQDMLLQARSDDNHRVSTELNMLLDRAVNLAYKSQRTADLGIEILLHLDYDETIDKLMCFSSELSRAFINLVDNAYYALQQRQQQCTQSQQDFQPHLWVKTHKVGDLVRISIKDNGIGIPPDIRDKIFQPFFSTKPTVTGTGLGLSLTHDIIVDKHGGTLAVKSEIGTYTEFVIELPIC